MSGCAYTAFPQALQNLRGTQSQPLHVSLPQAPHSVGVQRYLLKGIHSAERFKIGSAALSLQPYRARADLMAELVFCMSSSSSSS